MNLYKFRPLFTCCNYDRVVSIIQKGFYCCNFLDFNDVNEGVFPVTDQTNEVELSDKLEYRICSFSDEEALSSQLMWGHYAGAGMGVAIEIEVEPVESLKKVHCDSLGRYANLCEILTNKSVEWKYEKEWRYLSTDQKKYYKADITKFYFGTPYRHLTNYDEIKTKHHKLQKYLELSELLKAECNKRNISYEDYDLSGKRLGPPKSTFI